MLSNEQSITRRFSHHGGSRGNLINYMPFQFHILCDWLNECKGKLIDFSFYVFYLKFQIMIIIFPKELLNLVLGATA
jgi:hypothetical protein